LRRFLDTEKFCDVLLVVGQCREKIPVARAFLASASDALEAMLTSTMLEGRPGAQIEIPDLEPAGMRAIIKYAYAGDTEVSFDALVPAFVAARKYQVRALREACLEEVRRCTCTDAALTILETSACNGEDELVTACTSSPALGSSSIQKALSSPAFAALSEDGLKRLVQLEACQKSPAQPLWDACQSWARNAGGKDWRPRLRTLAPLLPVHGLSCKYLASLVEEELLAKGQIVGALHQLGDAIPLAGAWTCQYEGTTIWYTIQVGDDGRLPCVCVLKIKLEDVEDTADFEGILKPSDGWYIAEFGRDMAIRLRQCSVNKLQLQLKAHVDGEWSSSLVGERWI